MFTRRVCLQGLLGAAAVNQLGSPQANAASDTADLTRYVDLKIGTGGHGHTYPGATVPFGAVQLSPDTGTDGWDWCSGYHRSDSSLMGFSHTHLSGTGIGDMLDILLMPGVGTVHTDPGTKENPSSGYRARFSHADEHMEPGYYAVKLQDNGVEVELTATSRAGMHRYRFPAADGQHFIIDLAHGISDRPDGATNVLSGQWKQLDASTIAGGRVVGDWAKGRHIYFAMKFSVPFDSHEIVPGPNAALPLKAVLHYSSASARTVIVKTGISGVSVEGALNNLETEIPDFDFDKVRQNAHEAWQSALSKIRIETPDSNRQTIFYTALYHAMVGPTLFDDIDGKYRGMDGKVHTLAQGAHNYSTFSLWDTYRALHPLYTLMVPERVPDMVNCLIRMAGESPDGMPVWPLQGVETNCMTGYHSAVVIAEAQAKGFAGIDFESAYKHMRRRAFEDGRLGLDVYRQRGYCPADQVEESVSKTLEYAYDDWAVAAVARRVGAAQDAETLTASAHNYRHLFDKQSAFMRPRLANEKWAQPFDPRGVGHSKRWRDFTECNAWQATFLVQHDLPSYIEFFGGRERFVHKLDELFNQSSELPPDAPPDIAGLVGQYAHGNEPSHHIAYLYSFAGAPWKTQQRVRMLLDTMYKNDPDGLAGNEDCGQMSSWYILSALGFYAVDPVSAEWVFGTPLFDKAVVDVGSGRTLMLTAKRASPDHAYIQSVAWNGARYDKFSFPHSMLREGGEFVFTMGPEPNHNFGV